MDNIKLAFFVIFTRFLYSVYFQNFLKLTDFRLKCSIWSREIKIIGFWWKLTNDFIKLNSPREIDKKCRIWSFVIFNCQRNNVLEHILLEHKIQVDFFRTVCDRKLQSFCILRSIQKVHSGKNISIFGSEFLLSKMPNFYWKL